MTFLIVLCTANRGFNVVVVVVVVVVGAGVFVIIRSLTLFLTNNRFLCLQCPAGCPSVCCPCIQTVSRRVPDPDVLEPFTYPQPQIAGDQRRQIDRLLL